MASGELLKKKDEIEQKIRLAEANRQTCTPQFSSATKEWLNESEETLARADEIKRKYVNRKRHPFRRCLNMLLNYKVGKDASKRKADIEQLISSAPYPDTNYIALPPLAREMPVPAKIVGQEGYLSKALSYINNGSQYITGIYGMPGVGKTVLLRSINNHFTSNGEGFNHVIFVEVGKEMNLDKIQKEIACQVGLLLRADEDPSSRATAIFNFLKPIKFLLLIDGLWEYLDLDEIGVPHPSAHHVIVLATSSWDVCSSMRAKECSVQLKCLKEEEAMELFREGVGKEIDDTERECLAESIVLECSGLPLAIKAVARALSSKRTREWQVTLKLLQNSQFVEVIGTDIFRVLLASYANLRDDRTRKCFLLCSLWAKNSDIREKEFIESLITGGLIEACGDPREVHDKGHCIVEELKRACLLEPGNGNGNPVRVHNVVRALAFWIKSEIDLRPWKICVLIRGKRSTCLVIHKLLCLRIEFPGKLIKRLDSDGSSIYYEVGPPTIVSGYLRSQIEPRILVERDDPGNCPLDETTDVHNQPSKMHQVSMACDLAVSMLPTAQHWESCFREPTSARCFYLTVLSSPGAVCILREMCAVKNGLTYFTMEEPTDLVGPYTLMERLIWHIMSTMAVNLGISLGELARALCLMYLLLIFLQRIIPILIFCHSWMKKWSKEKQSNENSTALMTHRREVSNHPVKYYIALPYLKFVVEALIICEFRIHFEMKLFMTPNYWRCFLCLRAVPVLLVEALKGFFMGQKTKGKRSLNVERSLGLVTAIYCCFMLCFDL